MGSIREKLTLELLWVNSLHGHWLFGRGLKDDNSFKNECFRLCKNCVVWSVRRTSVLDRLAFELVRLVSQISMDDGPGLPSWWVGWEATAWEAGWVEGWGVPLDAGPASRANRFRRIWRHKIMVRSVFDVPSRLASTINCTHSLTIKSFSPLLDFPTLTCLFGYEVANFSSPRPPHCKWTDSGSLKTISHTHFRYQPLFRGFHSTSFWPNGKWTEKGSSNYWIGIARLQTLDFSLDDLRAFLWLWYTWF